MQYHVCLTLMTAMAICMDDDIVMNTNYPYKLIDCTFYQHEATYIL